MRIKRKKSQPEYLYLVCVVTSMDDVPLLI